MHMHSASFYYIVAPHPLGATAVTLAISNSKDNSNSTTTHNNRNASNSKKESNYRTANLVGTPAKAGMLAKAVGNGHAGRPIYRRDTIIIKDDKIQKGNRHKCRNSREREGTSTKRTIAANSLEWIS
jgi:hypothetical protein